MKLLILPMFFPTNRRLPWPGRTLAWLLIIAVIVLPRSLDLDVFYARDELAIWPWADQFALAVWRGDPAGTLTTSDYPGIPMFWAQTLFLTVKYTLPGLFPETMIPIEQLDQQRGLALLAERRLAAGLLVSLQLIGAVWLVRRLFGWPPALLSAVFLGLDPFSLTEARVFRLEMVSAGFVCLSVLAYLLYLRQRRWGWVLLSGIMAGLAVSSKTSGGLIVPYIWLLLLLDWLWGNTSPRSTALASENRTADHRPPTAEKIFLHGSQLPADVISSQNAGWLERSKRTVVNGLIWAAGAIGAFWLIWPAMWVEPRAALDYLFTAGFGQAAGRSVWGDKVFFWGEVLPGDPGPYFYPVALAFRTTPLMWLGLLGALLVLGLSFSNKWGQNWSPKLALPFSEDRPGTGDRGPTLTTEQPGIEHSAPVSADKKSFTLGRLPWFSTAILLLFGYVFLTLLELTFIISKVDRFLIIIFPILSILTALGFTGLLTWLTPHSSLLTHHSSLITFHVTLLLAQLFFTLPVHPYYYTYWNPWLGGGRAAMAVLPMGSGEGIDEAMAYVNDRPHPETLSLVCGASHPWCNRTFKGETLRSAAYFDGSWVQADYATFYISHLQRQNYPPEIVDFFMAQPPAYQVDLAGAIYTWVYQVPSIATFAGEWNDLAGLGRLLGYTLSPLPDTPALPGQTIEATVWWINWGAGVDRVVLRLVDQSGYEWVRAGLAPLPEYASIPPARRAIVSGTAAVTLPPDTPPGLYFWRIGVLDPHSQQLLGEFEMPDEADRLTVEPGPLETDPGLVAIPYEVNQALAPEITLLGYAPPEQVLTVSSPTWLTLYWQATAAPGDYLVNLRLLDEAGQVVTRWQGQPAHGYYPTVQWRSGEIVRDVWPLQAPPETPVGRYNLEISLLNPAQPQSQNPKFSIPNLQVWSQPISFEIPEMQAEIDAKLAGRLTLLGYDLFFDTDGSGAGSLTPVLYWQSQADFQAAYEVILTLRNADSNAVLTEWRVPLGSDEAKRFWKAGEVINTTYQFEIEGINQGRYHLDIALQAENSAPTGPTSTRIENIQDKVVVRLVNRVGG